MFIGHFAPAFIAATHPKAPNLAVLIIASQLVDYAFFGFALFGIENFRITPGITVMNPLDLYDMPYTHSLVGTLGWAIAFGAIVYAYSKDWITAFIAAAVVEAHWWLDLIVHTQDLTLAGMPPKFGFALWNYPAIAMPLEFILIFGSVAFYISKTHKITGQKSHALFAMIAILCVFQAFDWFAPKPESADASFMIMALLSFSIVAAIGWWLSKCRRADG